MIYRLWKLSIRWIPLAGMSVGIAAAQVVDDLPPAQEDVCDSFGSLSAFSTSRLTPFGGQFSMTTTGSATVAASGQIRGVRNANTFTAYRGGPPAYRFSDLVGSVEAVLLYEGGVLNLFTSSTTASTHDFIGFSIGGDQGNQFVMNGRHTSGFGEFLLETTQSATIGQKYHVVWQCLGASNVIYINGALASATNAAGLSTAHGQWFGTMTNRTTNTILGLTRSSQSATSGTVYSVNITPVVWSAATIRDRYAWWKGQGL